MTECEETFLQSGSSRVVKKCALADGNAFLTFGDAKLQAQAQKIMSPEGKAALERALASAHGSLDKKVIATLTKRVEAVRKRMASFSTFNVTKKAATRQPSMEYIINPSSGNCPEGEELNEEECAALDGKTIMEQGPLEWVEAGSWAMPESCGCYIDDPKNAGELKVYFNRE